ncbi:MAG TPA: CBS domain-containing protein [Candidatus Acidoferrales bacterium]|nr:CBS domain-containing protein [Candidatus Acidoferrales bacterium]
MEDDIILEEEAIADERAAEAARLGAAILRQPIRALATLRPAISVPPAVSVRAAIDRMNQGSTGCVLVEVNGRLTGIFTERDVLTKIVGTTIDLDRTTVETVMTRNPESLSPDDRVSYALNKMSVGGFRHIPLVDDDGHPVGVVSMRNVVDYIVDLFGTDVLNLPPSPQHGARSREGA